MDTKAASSSAAAQQSPYPAPSHFTSARISGIDTDVTCISFSDKIMITLAQVGRVNHWVQVALATSANLDLLSTVQPQSISNDGPDASLLPYVNLTATTILGGTKPEFEVTGQTLATTVGTAVLMRNPEEQRMLVLGVGLAKAEIDRSSFDALVGLCLDVI